VPADSQNISKEYDILVNELALFNPELLDKKRILGISKSDMLDQELIAEIRKDLPVVPYVFFSSVTQTNLDKLKDLLWQVLQSD
jgi:GTP-binding protein